MLLLTRQRGAAERMYSDIDYRVHLLYTASSPRSRQEALRTMQSGVQMRAGEHVGRKELCRQLAGAHGQTVIVTFKDTMWHAVTQTISLKSRVRVAGNVCPSTRHVNCKTLHNTLCHGDFLGICGLLGMCCIVQTYLLAFVRYEIAKSTGCQLRNQQADQLSSSRRHTAKHQQPL